MTPKADAATLENAAMTPKADAVSQAADAIAQAADAAHSKADTASPAMIPSRYPARSALSAARVSGWLVSQPWHKICP